MSSENPYAAPEAVVADAPEEGSAAELIRREFIRHEVLLKSIGTLYGLGAFIFLAMGVGMFSSLAGEGGNFAGEDIGMVLMLLAFYGVTGLVMAAMAFGFRRLQPWVRYPGTALAAIGLLGIPIGTLINGYILYLIWCRAGRTVLEPGYRDIINATPHVKYQRSLGDKIATGIVILFLLGLVLMVIVGINT